MRLLYKALASVGMIALSAAATIGIRHLRMNAKNKAEDTPDQAPKADDNQDNAESQAEVKEDAENQENPEPQSDDDHHDEDQNQETAE